LDITGRRAQKRHESEEDAVAYDIARVSRDDAEVQDQPARQRRPGEDRQLRIRGGDADRRRQPLAFNKARQEAVLSRNAEGVNGAMQKSERRQPLDRELAGASP
jgi:hypothetical protein